MMAEAPVQGVGWPICIDEIYGHVTLDDEQREKETRGLVMTAIGAAAMPIASLPAIGNLLRLRRRAV